MEEKLRVAEIVQSGPYVHNTLRINSLNGHGKPNPCKHADLLALQAWLAALDDFRNRIDHPWSSLKYGLPLCWDLAEYLRDMVRALRRDSPLIRLFLTAEVVNQ